jgi:NAD(P)-dependent dehydrogenase (short-subunit alcohol dehydrogenase family)
MSETGLDGKVAIVTGASRGIGKAIALGLARAGASVVVAARSQERRPDVSGTIHDTVAEIEDAGGKALAVACNVRDDDSIRRLVERTLDEYGAVDILINNAGIGGYTPFLQLSVKEWDLPMDIDLRAPFVTCKAVVPIMIEQGGGSIVNVSSQAADNIFSSTLGQDRDAGITLVGQAYGTAKAGLERFTWGLAAELGSYNIAVNALKPLRPVATEGFRSQRPDADFSTWATPDDMVKAATYLAAQNARGQTGAIITAKELVRRLGL